MEDNTPIDTGPQPEVLTDLGDGGTTPLQHKNGAKEPEPEVAVEVHKTPSDAIKAAMAKVQAEGDGDDADEVKAKEPEKPVKAEKVEIKDNVIEGKDLDKAGEKDATKAAPSEGKQINAPSRLLPSERDVWVNTPRAVQGAFERIEKEIEEVSARSAESVRFHEELREFDGMAKAANTTVKDALSRYVEFDKEIAADFGKGVSTIMKNFGKNPTEAVAQIMRASGVTPQQLGSYLSGNPAQPQQQAQQQRPVDPVAQAALQKIEQLEAKLAQQEQTTQKQALLQDIEQRVVNPAKESMPRIDELEPHIVKMLETGYIDFSLSPEVRLREAYFAADRMYPALQKAIEEVADLDDPEDAPRVLRKSISGPPGKSSVSGGKPKIMTVRDSIAAAIRSAH